MISLLHSIDSSFLNVLILLPFNDIGSPSDTDSEYNNPPTDRGRFSLSCSLDNVIIHPHRDMRSNTRKIDKYSPYFWGKQGAPPRRILMSPIFPDRHFLEIFRKCFLKTGLRSARGGKKSGFSEVILSLLQQEINVLWQEEFYTVYNSSCG